MPLQIRFYGRSDVGRRRTTNEDSFVLCEDEGLGVVCDGMGGHHAGEVASRMAVDVLAERVAKDLPRLQRPGLKLSQVRRLAQRLAVDWAGEANHQVHNAGHGKTDGDDKVRARMGTTLAFVLFVTDFVVVLNVGDSRIYRIRDRLIDQISEDHTIVADARRKPGDNRPPRKRKYVTRALGTKPTVEPDVRLLEVAPDDVFVLCSDGLTDLVEDEEIERIVRKAGPDRRLAVRTLINLANKRGGTDNVTVVVAEVCGDPHDENDDTAELPILKP